MPDSNFAATFLQARLCVNKSIEMSQELRLSEDEGLKLFNTIPEVVFRIDVSGRFQFLNQAWQQHTGHLIERSVGESLQCFMPAEE